MSKPKCYQGQEGCLGYILDLADDYDGARTIESLKALIDEIRREAVQGVVKKEEYGK